MPRRILPIIRVAFVAIVVGVSIWTAPAQRTVRFAEIQIVSRAKISQTEFRVFDLINRQRMKYGLPLLEWDDQLARLARNYSRKMADENFFAHIDSDGNDVAARAEAMRIRGWQRIGENLFECEGVSDPIALSVRGWMQSPSHRENLLDDSWTTTGIGVAETSDGRFYATQVFLQN